MHQLWISKCTSTRLVYPLLQLLFSMKSIGFHRYTYLHPPNPQHFTWNIHQHWGICMLRMLVIMTINVCSILIDRNMLHQQSSKAYGSLVLLIKKSLWLRNDIWKKKPVTWLKKAKTWPSGKLWIDVLFSQILAQIAKQLTCLDLSTN